MQLDDQELIARLTAELSDALGVNAPPAAARVSRWPGGFPQYRPGHLDVVAGIASALASDLPGVSLAGASYRGVGIPACIASGEAAAADALRHSAAVSQRAIQGRP